MFFRPHIKTINERLRFRRRTRAFGLSGGVALLLLLAINAGHAGPIELFPRLINLPANSGKPLFVDVEGNGYCNMLVIDTVEKTLLNYRQGPDGFSSSPDQAIPLPPQTAWVAACDVDAHPGLELLMSTSRGLCYSRQNAGLFEAKQRTLIEARQVFTNCDFPVLTVLATNQAGTNDLIPVISAGQTVLYHRNSAYEWSPGPPRTLDGKQIAWTVNSDEWSEPWTLGPNPAHSLSVQQTFRVKPESTGNQPPTDKAILKLMADLQKNTAGWPPRTCSLDVDGDGRTDLVLWQVSGKVNFKTDIYIFLRGADQKLPERPTQILHCRGFPISIDPMGMPTPVIDLNGDGHHELVLLEFNIGMTSASGLVNAVLSHGLDCSLAIRPFQNGAFTRSPIASVPVTTILPAEVLSGWPCFIQGDFNGDGRPDLLVRRSDTQWNIFFSTRDGSYFESQPALTFNIPGQGYMEIKDLNGDGLSDVIWHETETNRLAIFMSPPRPTRSKNP
jgi:hypothetical protein